MALAAIPAGRMLHPYLSYRSGSCMAGNAVFTQLQAVGNERGGVGQGGPAKPRRADGFPVTPYKKIPGSCLGVALIAERVFRVGSDGDKFVILLGVTATGMAGKAVRLIAAEAEIDPMGNYWRRSRKLALGVILVQRSAA